MGENWNTNAGTNGVVKDYPVKFDNIENLMLLKSKPYGARAEARFNNFTIGQNGTVQITLIPQQRFFVGIGPLQLAHDQEWFFIENGKISSEGILNKGCPVKYNQPHKLSLQLKEGFLTAWLDDNLILSNIKCDIPTSNNAVSIGTWDSDKLLFKSELISNFQQGSPATPVINIEKYQESDWLVNTEAEGVKADCHFKLPDGREGMSLCSLAGKIAATAKFDKLFGDNAYIDMTVKLPERFKLKIGPVLISYGGGWVRYGWFVTGNMQKRGNGRVFCQIPVRTDKFVNMKISIKNKVLNVMYDNMVVVQDLPMEMPAAGNVFYIETWGSDKVEFTVNEISSTPKDIILATVKHPILDNEQ
jgi:hypothetical protein